MDGVDLDRVLGDLLRRSHVLEPDDLPAAVAKTAAQLGADNVRIYLADYEQRELRLLARPGQGMGEALSIDSTMAGRAFRTEQPTDRADEGSRRVLMPLTDGTHRIGVLELCLPLGDATPAEAWRAFAALVADLVITKSSYGDTITVTRRRQPMAVRAEAQRVLLPPLTLISARLIVTGLLEPSYEVAGDAFDYALNGDVLHLAILDAMGHSLSATLTATVALSAYRNARRGGGTLVESWRAADTAVSNEFAGERFATAVLAELDLATGRLRAVNAGHPPALVVRGNRVVARCADVPTLPIGLGGDTPEVTETALEPGDRLVLFTDGIVEARSHTGELFGEDRLVDHLARELDTGLPAPEAVRRLVRAVGEHQKGELRDDATMLLVEWRGAERSAPHPAAT